MIERDVVHDDLLGPLRLCASCEEEWPDDDDFYLPGDRLCRACRWERDERRRWAVRTAVRRYRARLRSPS